MAMTVGGIHRRRGRGTAPRDGLQALRRSGWRKSSSACARAWRKGLHRRVADEIVRSITSFALYGFPESHAASFALIAYASAYLKCHHPAAFFAAMLNCYPMGFYHPATLVKDAQRHGVEILPIDVTRSTGNAPGIETFVDGRPSPSGEWVSPPPGLKYVTGLREEVGLRIEAERARATIRFDCRFHRAHRDPIAASSMRSPTPVRSHASGSSAARRYGKPPRSSAIQRACSPASSRREAPLHRSPGMSPLDETRADYSTMGLTAGPHLMAHLRERLTARGVSSAADVTHACKHRRVGENRRRS